MKTPFNSTISDQGSQKKAIFCARDVFAVTPFIWLLFWSTSRVLKVQTQPFFEFAIAAICALKKIKRSKLGILTHQPTWHIDHQLLPGPECQKHSSAEHTLAGWRTSPVLGAMQEIYKRWKFIRCYLNLESATYNLYRAGFKLFHFFSCV